MTDISRLRHELIGRVLGNPGTAPKELRQNAFDKTGLDDPLGTLVEKVAHRSDAVTDEDIAAARSAGLSEDQIFEIVVCAAVGQADRQYTSALDVLARVAGEGGDRR
jgi:alkylhydroperoxidase/carboxymuconolactone decarboxylase family protein YurZ